MRNVSFFVLGKQKKENNFRKFVNVLCVLGLLFHLIQCCLHSFVFFSFTFVEISLRLLLLSVKIRRILMAICLGCCQTGCFCVLILNRTKLQIHSTFYWSGQLQFISLLGEKCLNMPDSKQTKPLWLKRQYFDNVNRI